MPLSRNLWSVSSISSHWLRNILVLLICHAVTRSKILSFLSFFFFSPHLYWLLTYLANMGAIQILCLSTEKYQTSFLISAVLMQRKVIARGAVITER